MSIESRPSFPEAVEGVLEDEGGDAPLAEERQRHEVPPPVEEVVTRPRVLDDERPPPSLSYTQNPMPSTIYRALSVRLQDY